MVRIQFHTYGGYCREACIPMAGMQLRTYGGYCREACIPMVGMQLRPTYVVSIKI